MPGPPLRSGTVVDTAVRAPSGAAVSTADGDRRRTGGRRDEDRMAFALLSALATAVLVVDDAERVRVANPAATALGLVQNDTVAVPALRALAAAARRTGCEQEEVVTLPVPLEPPFTRPRHDRPAPEARVRAVVLAQLGVALLLDDVTEQRRVDAVRRDFVANVSHELKTPVGALQLLAEALVESHDDPVTVRRFAARMTTEARRLSNLVQELIDLSRLQGAEPMRHDHGISVAAVVAEAVDRARLPAEAKDIVVAVAGDSTLVVPGDERQLVTAVTNLLDNAVAYSPSGTRVTVGMVRRGDLVELSVTDEGIGIGEADKERVFERFYRVDSARSRATGGTGLGLAIVKHVAANHDGEVRLWSREGAGSTFTLCLPIAVRP